MVNTTLYIKMPPTSYIIWMNDRQDLTLVDDRFSKIIYVWFKQFAIMDE